MKVGIIVNRRAGHGRTRALVDSLLSFARSEGISLSVGTTGAPGDGTLISRRLARESDVLCVVGGDGTVHEVVNGIMPDPVPIVIVPTGTGNDFASLVRSPRTPRQFVDTLRQGYAAKIDVLDFGERFCVNSAGLGFEGLVNRHSQSSRVKGPLLYLGAVFRAMVSYTCPHFRVETREGEIIEGKKLLVSIGNGVRTGGGFYLTPEAYPDDGWIDLCVVEPVGRARMMVLLPTTLRGTHTGHREVRMIRTASLTVESDPPHHLHIDGEYMGTRRRLVVRLAHRVLPVLCAADGPHRLKHAPEKLL